MKLMKIIATCESLDELAPTPVEHAENETELAEAQAVSDSTYKEIDDIDTGVTDALAGMDRLEEATDIVSAGDGPEATAAEVVAVESMMASIHQSLGLPYHSVTMESLGGNSRAELVATMESKMEAIGQAVLNGLKAVWETVKRFINNLFRNKEALKKYLLGVQAKVGEIQGTSRPANAGSFNSEARCLEGLKTAAAMQDMVQVAAVELQNVIQTHQSELQNANAVTVARAIGVPCNKLLESGTSMSGKGGENTELRGLVSGNKGIPLYVEGSNDILRTPKVYSQAVGQDEGLTQQQASGLINKAIDALDKFMLLKRFENVFGGAFKMIRDLLMASYHRLRGKPSKGAVRTPEQTDHTQQSNKKVMVMAFRGVAHSFGSMMPREIFMVISNVGKYVNACIAAKSPSSGGNAMAGSSGS